MIIFIYTIMALIATMAGSITGMGGGVIMKPVMDLMGDYDAATIGVLSSVTVFVMSIVACLRQQKDRGGIKVISLVVLGIGSILGGLAGQFMFEATVKAAANDSMVKIIQNSVLCFLIAIIFFYMIFKSKIPSLNLKNPVFYGLTGAFLGIASSFLGIGGGPINVAILMFLFGLDIKTATFSSVITILAAQISKLSMAAVTTNFFSGMTLIVLPFMAIAAVVGAFVGSLIKKKISGGAVAVCFNVMQLVIMGICITNIITLSIS